MQYAEYIIIIIIDVVLSCIVRFVTFEHQIIIWKLKFNWPLRMCLNNAMRQQHNTIYSVTHKNYIHCIVYTLCVLAPSNTIDKRQWIIFISFRIYILCAHNISAHALSQNEQGMPMIINNNMARMHLLFRFLLEIRIYIYGHHTHIPTQMHTKIIIHFYSH